jgi:hypothetical protein
MQIKDMLLKALKVSHKVTANQFREIIKGNGLIVEYSSVDSLSELLGCPLTNELIDMRRSEKNAGEIEK